MRRHHRLLTAALVPVTALLMAAAPAPGDDCQLIEGADTPDNPDDDVSVCEVDTWFHQADTKFGNLAATGETPFPSFDRNEPAESVQAGAGGGYVGVSAFDFAGDVTGTEFHPGGAVTYVGTYTGAIDSLAITQYLFASPSDKSAFGEHLFRLKVEIDGVSVFESDFIEGSAAPLNDTALEDPVQNFQIAVTGLHDFLPATDGEERELKIVINPFVPTNETMYVYDTTEVPSQLTFNPTDLSGFTVVN